MGTSEEQGEIAFIACAILFAVTAIGLATAWWLQHKKYLKSKAQLRERNERKAKGKTFDPSKVRADQDPAVVKSRITRVWALARQAEEVGFRGASHGVSATGMNPGLRKTYDPPADSVEGKFIRAATLFRAEVLSIYEAYIEVLRDITPPKGASEMTSTRAPELLQSLEPYLGKLEKVGMMVEDYESLIRDNASNAAMMDTASLMLKKTETLSREWNQISKAMPRLKTPKDGRFDLGWDVKGPKCLALEARLAEHLSFVDKRRAGLLPESFELGQSKRFADKVWSYFPAQVRRHPIFYSLIAALYIAVMMPFFIGIGQDSWRGLFGTFLPVPPQYCIDCLPGGKGVEVQRILVPVIYAFMHTAMLSLALLPLPLCRGLLRDFTNAGANDRGIFPIEDAVWIHKVFGAEMLAALFIAPFFWLIAMGSTCLGTSTSEQVAITKACSAFAPFVVDAKAGPIPPANNVSQHVIMTDLAFDSFEGASFFDARDNVLFLRAVAWPLFFGVTPWILRRGDMTFPKFFPAFIVRNWFEIVTYSHYFVAWAAAALAVYARFEVFFVILPGFGLLFIEKVREWTVHSYTAPIRFGKNANRESFTLLHRSSVDERPTAVELVIKRPEGFHFTAGQYIFIKVPTIDSVWHAFSLGSCPADDAVHLHIGVIGGQKNNWIEPTDEDPDFRQKNPTWTYKLFAAVRDRVKGGGEYEPLHAVVRGPYGSPFQSCFTRRYKASVLIGSGTGLTSALSVLKEVIERRRAGEPTSDRVWFVWTCRNVRDLRWCWRTLQQAIVEACRTGAIDVPEGWSAATSASLGWLGVSIFVSQANKKDLMAFLGYSDTPSENVPEDDFDYHDADMLPTGPPPKKGGNDEEDLPPRPKASVRLPKSGALPDGPLPPRFPSAEEDEFELPPTPGPRAPKAVVSFDEAPPIPPKTRSSDAENPFNVGENDSDGDSDDDYVPPPLPPKAHHGAASEALPLQAEMALLRSKSSAETDDRSFWASAATIDFSSQMYGNKETVSGSSAHTDAAAADQLNARFEAGFQLKMPTMAPRRKPPPIPPPEENTRKSRRRTRKEAKAAKKHSKTFFDIGEEDEDDKEDYYVVSTTVRNAGNRGRTTRKAADPIIMDDIYVSSQQRDVLHTCPNDVKSVLKRVATQRAGSSGAPVPSTDGQSDIEALVQQFLAAGGSNNRRAEEQLLINLLERSKGRQRLDIGSWLKEQVIATSMDTKGAHIKDLFQELQIAEDFDNKGRPRGIAACYCGPSGLAASLGGVAREMNVTFEYLAHAD